MIELLWNGVGAIQLHNKLTGIPMDVTNKKGFSGVMLNTMHLIVLEVATVTQLLVWWERRKMKHKPTDLMSNNEVLT